MNTVMPADQLEKALLNPAAVFACPIDVVQAAGIPRDRKIEILRRWEYDVREQEVAQEENMTGSMPVALSHVLDALNSLGSEHDAENAPPTKQGGI